jgi:hypothetical protein
MRYKIFAIGTPRLVRRKRRNPAKRRTKDATLTFP